MKILPYGIPHPLYWLKEGTLNEVIQKNKKQETMTLLQNYCTCAYTEKVTALLLLGISAVIM